MTVLLNLYLLVVYQRQTEVRKGLKDVGFGLANACEIFDFLFLRMDGQP